MAPFSHYCYSVYIIAVATLFLCEVNCTNSDVDGHLQLGIKLLAKGQLQDALIHFHAAIDEDPKNYLSYYRRATVYLALGRSRQGLNDLDEVIKLKPDFLAARTQRASVLVKLGRLDEAYIELEKVLMNEPHNEAASKLMQDIEPLKQKLELIKTDLEMGFYSESIGGITEMIEACPWDSDLRELRITACLASGDNALAISDMRVVTKINQASTDAFYRLASLYYKVGNVDQSLIEIRECLKLDPDNQTCFKLYKKVKKVAKLINKAQDEQNNEDYLACTESSKKVLKEELLEPEVKFLAYEKLCQSEAKNDRLQKALEYCREALQIKEEARIYCDRAEVHILLEQLDEALTDFQNALRVDDTIACGKKGIEKVQQLKKNSSKKDYYKILNVSRGASKKEISKAYRSLAQKWHPDHFEGDEKKEAQRRFIEIAAAKEVLTDKEKRKMFDSGRDPLDPEEQAHGGYGGFNPFDHFRQGGFHQGGGPFEFKFHFN